MQKLEVGQPYELFYGRDMTGQTGSIFECAEDGTLILSIYLDNMTEVEKQLLRFGKIQVRVLEEGDFIYTLLNFGRDFIFELDFDPTLYTDNRINYIIKSNLVHLISVESNNNLIQTLRLINAPLKLFSKWYKVWNNAKEIDNYSEKYKRWVNDLQNRYTTVQLWQYGSYVGKMGE